MVVQLTAGEGFMVGKDRYEFLIKSKESARIQAKVCSDHVCDLDHSVVLRLWENTLATRTFNIEAENTEWRNLYKNESII